MPGGAAAVQTKIRDCNNRLILNGAIFREDWKDFQCSHLRQNGLTEIRNATQARTNGVELDLSWAATCNLTISGAWPGTTPG